MINPNTFRNEAFKISEIFSEIEMNLLKKISRQLNKDTHLNVNDWKVLKMLELSKFTQNRDKILWKAKQINKELAKLLKDAFYKGIKESDINARILKDLGGIQDEVMDSISFFHLNKDRLDTIIKASFEDITRGLASIYGDLGRQYQKTLQRAIFGVTRGTETIRESVRIATKQLAREGIGYVTYADGKKITTRSYIEMATRSACTRSALLSNTLRNREYGYTLCKISEYGGCSPTCQPWQGKIYFDDMFGGANDTEYEYLSVAINRGLFHPNCRHYKYPYDPDVQDYKPPMENDPKLYQREQEQRYNERMIREWKKRREVSTGKDKEYARMKVGEWQKRNIELLRTDDRLRRDYPREQVE